MNWRNAHLESLKANDPNLLAGLKAIGELEAHLSSVEDRAERQFQALADQLEAQLDQEHAERSGYLNRVQALKEAESQVMREVVLVPEPATAPTAVAVVREEECPHG